MIKDKERAKKYLKAWKLKNPDKVEAYRQKHKEYYLKTKEHHAQKVKEWRRKNPDKVEGYAKKWRLNNRDKANQASLAWTKRNPEKVLANRRRYILEHPDFYKDFNKRNPYRLYKRFGIDITALAIKQNSRCAICEKKVEKLCVDHCHKKDTFRGLLCRECNAGLGSFYDNIEFLKSAIKYLQNAP